MLFRHGLSISEIRGLTLLLNQERYGQGRHANGPLPVAELERTVFKSLLKWERRVRSEPHAARVASLASLMAREVPEPLWIVPDLLPEGLTLGLALSVAGGYPALGKPLAQPRDVLYLGLEDSENRLKRRALTLLAGRPAPEGFHYQAAWEPLAAGGFDELRGWLDTHPDARLVIIDTLARVRVPSGGNGSIYQEDYTLMGQLQELAAEYHIALVLVHHTRKMESADAFDTISGSTGLTGAADTSIVLTRERNQPDAVLHLTGRDIEEQTLALRFAPATGAWTLLGTTSERQQS